MFASQLLAGRAFNGDIDTAVTSSSQLTRGNDVLRMKRLPHCEPEAWGNATRDIPFFLARGGDREDSAW